MRRLLIAPLLLVSTTVHAQDHTDVVARVKAEIIAQGVNLQSSPGTDDNPCGPFLVTNLAALYLKGEGAGLLDKKGGVACEWPVGSGNSYATDIIAYPDGRIYDVIVAKGTENRPAWNPAAVGVDPKRWRAPIAPSTVTPTPPPAPTPVPAPAPLPSTDLSPVLNALEVMRMQQQADTAAILARIDLFEQHAKGAFYNFIKTYGPMLLGVLGLLGGIAK